MQNVYVLIDKVILLYDYFLLYCHNYTVRQCSNDEWLSIPINVRKEKYMSIRDRSFLIDAFRKYASFCFSPTVGMYDLGACCNDEANHIVAYGILNEMKKTENMFDAQQLNVDFIMECMDDIENEFDIADIQAQNIVNHLSYTHQHIDVKTFIQRVDAEVACEDEDD